MVLCEAYTELLITPASTLLREEDEQEQREDGTAVVVQAGSKYPSCDACIVQGSCSWYEAILLARLSGNPRRDSACIPCKSRQVACNISADLVATFRDTLGVGGTKRKPSDTGDLGPEPAKRLKDVETKIDLVLDKLSMIQGRLDSIDEKTSKAIGICEQVENETINHRMILRNTDTSVNCLEIHYGNLVNFFGIQRDVQEYAKYLALN